jgi:hypothetical protein
VRRDFAQNQTMRDIFAWMDLRMRLRIALAAIVASAIFPLDGRAQIGVMRPSQGAATTSLDQSGGTLEVPPRVAAPAPSAPQDRTGESPAQSASPAAAQNADQTGDVIEHPPPAPGKAAAAVQLPYVGLAVQYIVSKDVPGKEVHGLEVVGVDPNSPAEIAGIHGRGQMTRVGASGATAGALMPPLDLVVMPLLKKAGELGADGDLIIAIDDNRVETDNDLKAALQNAKPGDLLYLTVARPHRDGTHETLKLPVKLGQPRS